MRVRNLFVTEKNTVCCYICGMYIHYNYNSNHQLMTFEQKNQAQADDNASKLNSL